jgi:hypothetical protein
VISRSVDGTAPAACRWARCWVTRAIGATVPPRAVPDLDRVVATPGDQTPTIAAERDAAHQARVAAEAADQFAGLTVPDVDRAVFTRGCDPAALFVGTEGDGVHITVVSPEGLKFLAGLDIPDLHGVLRASGRQAPGVG